MQFGMVKAFIGAGVHSRILTEPNSSVEVSIVDAGSKIDGPFVPSFIFSIKSGRRSNRYGSRRRNTQILECV